VTAEDTNRVPRTVFSVDDLPLARRYDVWRESIACIFDVDRSRTLRQDDVFHATVDSHLIGPIMLARTATRRQVWRRSPSTIARDGMDHYMIQLYEEGSQDVSWSGGSTGTRAGGLMVYDLAQEMSARTADFTNLSLIIPRSLLEPALRQPDDQHMRALHDTEPLVTVLRDHMRSLKVCADRLSWREAMDLAPVTIGLLGACLNASIRDTPGGAEAMERVLLSSLKREIENRLGDPCLTPEELCRRFGLSRTRLYRLFEARGGVSRYIRERRLRAAFLALVDPERKTGPIGNIARDCGFASDSDFSRAFRVRFGMSPRAARHERASSGTDASRGPDFGPDRRWEHWLHDLVA
jgi:AraC-like DNA-binding protein